MQVCIFPWVIFFEWLFENQGYLVICVVKLRNENVSCRELYYYIYNSIIVEYLIMYGLQLLKANKTY